MTSVSGLRFLVTRTADDCRLWAGDLQALGAEAVAFPCIETLRVEAPGLEAELVEALSWATWLVLPSRRAVQAVADLVGRSNDHSGGSATLPDGLRLAVVGPATSKAAASLLGEPSLVAQGGTALALHQALIPRLGLDDRVVAAMSGVSDDEFKSAFGVAGVPFRRVDLYRTDSMAPVAVRCSASDLAVDFILLASPSAVEGLLNQVRLGPDVRLVSIGPTTSAAIRAAGLDVFAQASVRSLSGMLASMESEMALAGAAKSSSPPRPPPESSS
jgi:uroporphyrinogen-III synthase